MCEIDVEENNLRHDAEDIVERLMQPILLPYVKLDAMPRRAGNIMVESDLEFFEGEILDVLPPGFAKISDEISMMDDVDMYDPLNSLPCMSVRAPSLSSLSLGKLAGEHGGKDLAGSKVLQ